MTDKKGEMDKIGSADRKLMPSGKEKLFSVFEAYLDAKISYALEKTTFADLQMAEANLKDHLSEIAFLVE